MQVHMAKPSCSALQPSLHPCLILYLLREYLKQMADFALELWSTYAGDDHLHAFCTCVCVQFILRDNTT